MRHALGVAAIAAAMTLAVPAIAGKASYYGPGFHGRTTASGERFDQNAATCAHRTLRFGTRVKVTNLQNGRSAVCRVNDRGPFSPGRVIDVSKGIAAKIGMLRSGVVPVSIEIVK